jgi:hypothetical protein
VEKAATKDDIEDDTRCYTAPLFDSFDLSDQKGEEKLLGTSSWSRVVHNTIAMQQH